jgi:branched-chain amino acid transport system substrate-binding protein
MTRTLPQYGFLVVLLLVMAACAPGAAPEGTTTLGPEEPATTTTPAEEPGATTTEPAAAGEPIRIGFLAPTSSVSAESAQDMIDGWNMFWDEHGREVAGRPIEVLIEDDAGDPDVALSKVRLLVEQRQVHMLVGLLFANTGLAVADYVQEAGVPTFFQIVSADDLTQRGGVPVLLRPAGWSSSQPHHPFGEWISENQGCEQVYTIGSDYAFGHEVVGGFVNTFTDGGGQVAGQVWNPIGETDFSSYLATIQAAQPDCVFALQVGASGTRFLQSWNDFGLKDQIPLFAGEVLLDQSIIRGVDPPEILEGLISSGHYAEGRDAPATQEFVAAYDEQFGKLPSYYASASFAVGQWIAQALEDVGANVEETEAFLEAVKAVELEETALGPLRLDEYGNPIQNVYVRQVEIREDGRPWNVVLETFEEVSQFWNYDTEEFLQQPVYSRDYQGVDWP